MTVTEIARWCHELNRVVCELGGDHSQKPWHSAEQWQRDSAVKGVEYAVANPGATPEQQHDAWMSDKIADGWKFGERKDAGAKTHPCLVPYGQLPADQRLKDHVFRAVVQVMGSAGYPGS